MMTLILDLGHMIPPKVTCIRGEGVVYEFIKRTTIPVV